MVSLGNDMHQWYQSSRSSAVLRKNEKEIKRETTESDFLPSCCYDKSTETFDEKLRLALKRIDELIARNKKSPQKMIDVGFSPGNLSDYSLDHVSTYPQKIGCEEASIEEPSLSANGEESQQFVEARAGQDFQVSLQTKNFKSHKKYKLYSAVELDDRRNRGLCLWCDEKFFIGHECRKQKKLYAFELDGDQELVVHREMTGNAPLTVEEKLLEPLLDVELVEGKTSLMEPQVDVQLFEENVPHYDQDLIVDCVQMDSSGLSNSVLGDVNEIWEASEDLSMYNALQMFEELPKKTALENVAENYVILTTDFERNKLWLDDVGCGKLMATMFMNNSPSVIEALFSLFSRLGGLHQPWIALPELPLPPPEPPPMMI